ncbi:MAG: hypothetical protein WC595_04360 [Candidatus Nanoarchaeia archaeon]
MKNINQIIFGVAMLIILMTSACSLNQESNLSNEKINEWGESLAGWSNNHCETIKINGLEINKQGPNAGGCSGYYYKGGFTSKEETDVFRENIKGLAVKSSCEYNQLNKYLSKKINSDSRETLLNNISCLGKVEFLEGEWSVW